MTLSYTTTNQRGRLHLDFIKVSNFSEIADEFHKRVSEMVWCSVATVDTLGRPRTRVLHPIWGDHIGWIGTYRNSVKSKHIAKKPNMSIAYIKDPMKPVYVECTVEWIDDMAEKERVWALFKSIPEPYGYDPAPIFGAFDDENYGLLKLTPWRVEVYTIAVESKIWKA